MFCTAVLRVLVFHSTANSLTQAWAIVYWEKICYPMQQLFSMNIFCPFIIALTKLPDSRRDRGLHNLFVIEPILLRAILWIDVTSFVSLKWTSENFNASRWGERGFRQCWGQHWLLDQVCLCYNTNALRPITNKWCSDLTGDLFRDHSLGPGANQIRFRLD